MGRDFWASRGWEQRLRCCKYSTHVCYWWRAWFSLKPSYYQGNNLVISPYLTPKFNLENRLSKLDFISKSRSHCGIRFDSIYFYNYIMKSKCTSFIRKVRALTSFVSFREKQWYGSKHSQSNLCMLLKILREFPIHSCYWQMFALA